MNSFQNLKSNSYSFNSCDTCGAACCDGSKNILFSQILLKDFEAVAPYFPILFTIGTSGRIRPVILLTNGKDFCRYIENFKCSIYENRPSICRIYPLSGYIDNEIYIDSSCPAVSSNSGKMVDNTKILKDFDNEILYGYKEKYNQTVQEFQVYNKKENVELVMTIDEGKFYKFNDTFKNKYLELHHKSLKHLNEDYFKV